jgi:hypothetical protein
LKIENLSTLKIHKFKTQEQYEEAKVQGLVADSDISLVVDDNAGAVLYTPQTLTDEQKEQARVNIGVNGRTGLTLSAIDLLINILQHATYLEDMSSQIELLAKELMGGGDTGGGSLIITDDGNGNVIITASGDASITDDGEGNVTITASGSASITDDGNGNIIIA